MVFWGIIFAVALVLLILESSKPGRPLPQIAGWYARAIFLNGCQLMITLGTGLLYPVHLTTRNSLGLMTRKLSVTESHRLAQVLGTCSLRKPSVASANWAQVA